MQEQLGTEVAKVRKNKKVWVRYPGYEPETAAKTFAEAIAVQVVLDESMPEYKWHVVNGPRGWKDDKPICYIVKGARKEEK